jgi:RNA polymerase sigma-70 factor, ECF subfamily
VADPSSLDHQDHAGDSDGVRASTNGSGGRQAREPQQQPSLSQSGKRSHVHGSSTHASLILRVRERESPAWCELIDLYGPLVAHWCRRCGLDSHATADRVQEVFTSVAQGVERYQPQRSSGSFRAWLWTITRNKIRDAIRRDKHHIAPKGGSTAVGQLQRIPDENSLPDSEPTSPEILSTLVARGLEQVRGEFEPRSWAVFERSVIDGQATASVAEEFQLKPASVRQIRSRILRRLRQQLGDLE